MKRTKIVATLGPSSRDAETLAAMAEAGLDVVRINTAYGTSEDHAAWARLARRIGQSPDRTLGLLLDTQGPKVRVGSLPEPLALKVGEEVILGEGGIPVTYPEAVQALASGARVLLSDGIMELAVLGPAGRGMRCRVVRGGVLQAGKGVNFPGAVLPVAALTPKDRQALALARDLGFEYVALSFVQRPEDVAQARSIVGRDGPRVLGKIELAAAVGRMEEIVAACDGAMVARGDLGVEIDLFQVPLVQRRLVDLCNAHAKPVIVATQMLRSMVESPVPTRAEVSDIATAVWDGADAVMLSEETAVGRHPVEAVRVMAQAARAAETGEVPIRVPGLAPELVGEVPAAIANAARCVAEEIRARAIVCATVSGWTARLVASFRPRIPIVAATPHEPVARRLSLVWGVLPVIIPEVDDPAVLTDEALAGARRVGVVGPGDRVVFTAGLPFREAGTTNLVRVCTVP